MVSSCIKMVTTTAVNSLIAQANQNATGTPMLADSHSGHVAHQQMQRLLKPHTEANRKI